MSKARIGFVGVGGMGQAAHLRNYVNNDECEVVALAEVRPNLGQAVGKRYQIPNIYLSAEQMLESETLDGIVASQQFTLHGSIITPLYQAGIPILTEKPLAASEDVAERMLAALRDSGTWHMVGYHKRSDPAVMYAKAEIARLKETNELGAMKYVRLTMPTGDWVASGFTDNIQSDETGPRIEPDVEIDGSKPYINFVNYYIHQVNLLRHLFGEPYHVTFADPAGSLLVAESQSGLTGIIEINPYSTTIDWQESALIGFERGYIKIELPAPLAYNRPGRVEILSDPGNGKTPQTITPQMPWVHAMRQQATNFIRAIKGEIPPMCEAAEALEDLKIARQYLTAKESQ